MNKFKTYRLYHQRMHGELVEGGATIDGRVLNQQWCASDFTCKARNIEEATKKGREFWEDGEFGIGRICMIEEGEK